MTAPTPVPPDRRHFRRLDGARGIAVLMVVAFHCFGFTYGSRWHLPWQTDGLRATLHAARDRPPASFVALYPFTLGWAGVAVFFVLSGFVIHHSQVRAGPGPMDVAAFAARRAARIYPPYLLAVLAFAAVAWVRPGADHHDLVKQVLAHAALLQNLRAGTYWGLNPSLWSLAVEAQFYALYPLLWWVRRRTNAAAPLLLTVAVSLAWWAVMSARTAWRPMADVPAFAWWNTPFLWSSWAMGMFLADRFAAGRRAFGRPGVWGPALVLACLASTLTKPTWVFAFPLAAAAATVAVEQALWSARWDWLGHRWLVGVGLVSYTLYLWHQPLVEPAVHLVRRLGGSPAVRFPVVFAAVTVVAVAWSVALYAAVERPGQRLARRFAARP